MDNKTVKEIKKALDKTTMHPETVKLFKEYNKFYQGLSMSSENFIDGYIVGVKSRQAEIDLMKKEIESRGRQMTTLEAENERLRSTLLWIRKVRRDRFMPDHESDTIYRKCDEALNYEGE